MHSHRSYVEHLITFENIVAWNKFKSCLFETSCWVLIFGPPLLNTLRPRQDRRHFADDIFTCIFFNENCCISIKFSLKYVRKGPIDNNPALVQIMAWRRSGDRPLSEPMMVSLPTHICVTRPQWVKERVALAICVPMSVMIADISCSALWVRPHVVLSYRLSRWWWELVTFRVPRRFATSRSSCTIEICHNVPVPNRYQNYVTSIGLIMVQVRLVW